MLLVLMIRLQLLAVRRRVLGADQGMRGSGSLGLEIEVAPVRLGCCSRDDCDDLASCGIDGPIPGGSARNRFSSAQSAHLQAISAVRRKSVGSSGAWAVSDSSCSRHAATHCVRAGRAFLTFFLSQGCRLSRAGMCAVRQRIHLRQRQGVGHDARQQLGLLGDDQRPGQPGEHVRSVHFLGSPVGRCRCRDRSLRGPRPARARAFGRARPTPLSCGAWLQQRCSSSRTFRSIVSMVVPFMTARSSSWKVPQPCFSQTAATDLPGSTETSLIMTSPRKRADQPGVVECGERLQQIAGFRFFRIGSGVAVLAPLREDRRGQFEALRLEDRRVLSA